VIYNACKGLLLDLLKAPHDPPSPPAGSPGSVQIFRAAPNFLRFRLLAGLFGPCIGLLLEGIGLATVLASGHIPGAIGLAVVLVVTFFAALFSYFMIRLDYDMRYYVITDRSLRIRHGAMQIHESTFTYANVQNLTIHQGPVDRFLKIANLEIQTAGGGAAMRPNGQQGGGSMHQGMLLGIENAEHLRDLILALLKKYRDAGLGDTDDARRQSAAPAPAETGLSGDALARLREVRDEARLLLTAVSHK
jgi:membrane protein YdbS with pleckstrin-like domain